MAAAILAGCDGSKKKPGVVDDPLVGDRRVTFTPRDDVAFIDFFVPHHRSAIEMADEVIARGTTPEVVQMAQAMRDAQTAEIALMQAARAELTGVSESSQPVADEHMEADMARLRMLSGTELEQAFLDDMIPHHAAGLPVAHSAPPNLRRADMRDLAETIFGDQASEVGEMKALLAEEAGPPPAPGAETADTAPRGDVRIPYTAADDVAFIDFFVPHHRAAIEMADMVLERGAEPEVQTMAAQMKAAQEAEIADMLAARAELTGSTDVPALQDRHMEADMAEMRGLSGQDLDRAFLGHMIPHHAQALPVAHRSEPRLAREDMAELSRKIYAAQATEIGEMWEMLVRLGSIAGS